MVYIIFIKQPTLKEKLLLSREGICFGNTNLWIVECNLGTWRRMQVQIKSKYELTIIRGKIHKLME